MLRPEYDRITVWKQTQEKYKDEPLKTSILYSGYDSKELASFSKSHPHSIHFYKEDCIEVAIRYKHQGYNPLVLNMADWDVAGGCIETGSGAQEEECFRRSNYFKALHQSYYPLKRLDTIVSNNIEYYCRGASTGYILMDQTETLDMIAAPAIRFPRLSSDYKTFASESDVQTMEEKIRTLFYAGYKNGNDVLILSAWGCGAFGCPIRHVAAIFHKICKEYSGLFKHVVFAILGSNYDLFKTAFEKKILE
jgi:uncharacterized protein (TIGR02452 family)